MKIYLARSRGILWTIFTEDGVELSARQWASEHKALEWCKAFMSSFNSTYTIEVIDGTNTTDNQALDANSPKN